MKSLEDTYLVEAFKSLGTIIDYKNREISVLKYEVDKLKRENEQLKTILNKE